MIDYFPLKACARYEYDYESSEFGGPARAVIVILSVKKSGTHTAAYARLSVKLKGHSTCLDYFIRKTKEGVVTEDGIVTGGRLEFPFPLKKGRKWNSYPDASEIVSLAEKVSVPAGNFSGCLKIQTLLAGGDAGSAVRCYAPGVGYVSESYDGEDIRAQVKLLSVSRASKEELKPKKRCVKKRICCNAKTRPH